LTSFATGVHAFEWAFLISDAVYGFRIDGDRLTLENPDGFGGDYLRYAKTTVERASDCWID
jgi:hypothetical protein